MWRKKKELEGDRDVAEKGEPVGDAGLLESVGEDEKSSVNGVEGRGVWRDVKNLSE